MTDAITQHGTPDDDGSTSFLILTPWIGSTNLGLEAQFVVAPSLWPQVQSKPPRAGPLRIFAAGIMGRDSGRLARREIERQNTSIHAGYLHAYRGKGQTDSLDVLEALRPVLEPRLACPLPKTFESTESWLGIVDACIRALEVDLAVVELADLQKRDWTRGPTSVLGIVGPYGAAPYRGLRQAPHREAFVARLRQMIQEVGVFLQAASQGLVTDDDGESGED